MENKDCGTSNPRRQSIRSFLAELEPIPPIAGVTEFVSFVHSLTEKWEREDWTGRECDPEYLMNNVRLVGQAWFRGHADCNLSLRPGLYRESTSRHLAKSKESPKPDDDIESNKFEELFDLEHDMRIDFSSYGNLLNEANRANSAMDWYFTMQHHGVPTRLLDWTTNALAALFFAVDGLRRRQSQVVGDLANVAQDANLVSVWMIDAYWLADHLSSVWYAPLLPWSEDAGAYLPSLQKMVDTLGDVKALLPEYAMPIEPPAVHPRVAAQEGRFVIFGKIPELLDHKLRLDTHDSRTEDLRVRQIQIRIDDVELTLRGLAQLGISSRTLFPDFAGLAEFVSWKHLHKVSSR